MACKQPYQHAAGLRGWPQVAPHGSCGPLANPDLRPDRYPACPPDLLALLQVLLRSWRQDADGTYIVLYQSTNHRKARQAKASMFRWGGV